MSNDLNILITSISKKVPLIKAVRSSLHSLNLRGKIFGGDSNSQCIARYFVDDFWQMPTQDKLSVAFMLDYCRQYKINVIIPTRDGELPLYAQYKKDLAKAGISCFVSTSQAIETCLDKFAFYTRLISHHSSIIPTAIDIDALTPCQSYVVKERFGAGSRNIGLNLSFSEAKAWASSLRKPIFQPYIQGEEYSVDLFIDSSGHSKGAIARKRDYVVNGESQITSSLKDPQLEEVCIHIAEKIGLCGHAVFQLIRDTNNGIHLIECNPRFGGASTLSLAMGLKSFEWFFLEILQRSLPPFVRTMHEKRQVRYAEDLTFDL